MYIKNLKFISISFLATAATRRAATESGKDARKSVKANAFTGLSLQEAKQILNINDLHDIPKIRTVSFRVDVIYTLRDYRTMNIFSKLIANL